MTLLEVVLALALLAGIALAATGWTTTTARTSRQLADESAWSLAAAATLGLIGDDLASGDPIHDGVPVKADGRVLSIRTRDADGPAVHTIEHRDGRLILRRTARAQQQASETVLLDQVVQFQAILEAADDERTILSVAIERDNGVVIRRRWVLR
jgi:type II secretory pathway component PulJ